jgi:RNA polymerase sigma-70 factor (ECF subfamily)
MLTSLEDRRLVRRMLRGDERAFDEFFAGYFQRLFRFALRRVGDSDAAEDIVQASLVVAMTKLHTWRGEAALFTWLCTLCRHELSAYWRRAGRREETTLVEDAPEIRATLESLAAGAEGPDRELERREIARQVQLTLDFLPGRYGDVLEWKYILGLSVAEIAARLGTTEKAAESTLTRARQAFRTAFGALARPQQATP